MSSTGSETVEAGEEDGGVGMFEEDFFDGFALCRCSG